jgi:hypothetical protein
MKFYSVVFKVVDVHWERDEGRSCCGCVNAVENQIERHIVLENTTESKKRSNGDFVS